MAKASTKQPTTAVAAPKTTAVAAPLVDMSADAGAGFEQATKDSFAIPFLSILQSGSPQCKKSDGAYIKGAEEGMLLNTVTQEIFDTDKDQVFIIPCAYTLTYVEWAPRESGGGFKGEYDPATGLRMLRDTVRDDKGRDILPNGNNLARTDNFYILMMTDSGIPQRAVISMTSTQIKKAKRWMTAMSEMKARRPDNSVFNPPMFANVWQASTTPESNDKGSWFGWQLDHARALDLAEQADVDLYLAARQFKESILKGEVKTAARDDADTMREPGDDVDF